MGCKCASTASQQSEVWSLESRNVNVHKQGVSKNSIHQSSSLFVFSTSWRYCAFLNRFGFLFPFFVVLLKKIRSKSAAEEFKKLSTSHPVIRHFPWDRLLTLRALSILTHVYGLLTVPALNPSFHAYSRPKWNALFFKYTDDFSGREQISGDK